MGVDKLLQIFIYDICVQDNTDAIRC